ncbi:unnamed protein product [Rhizoctonia solani]|uniref:F-box domain-containing protein n=1 Tax=Rhizoctonia solani TaxID=456999 RepID=A0A8H3GFE7_9AGAM|nr:unnamed protein product [Rhizoctonia solani]
MLDELTTSSDLLCAAIERYSSACLAIQRSFERGEKPHINTPQLLFRMDAEVEVATSLGLRLKTAKANINWCRSQARSHETINKLPSELLARIFHLVHRAQPCAKRDYASDMKAEPIYPTTISLVCSRWREVAFSIPTLWTHIDISTSRLLNQQRLNGLVQRHLNQVGQLPLDLHVFDPPGHGHGVSFHHYGPIQDLIAQLASRAMSFDLDLKQEFDYANHYDILSTFIASCTPGKFTRLTLSQWGRGTHEFLDSTFNTPGTDGETISFERVEDILSRISVLRLSRLFPLWGSRAYHGLVELRLGEGRFPITESDFTNILRSSPDLHILQFSLHISDPLPVDHQPTPIPLKKLEVLNFSKLNSNKLSALLRWIAPGSKPLQFAIGLKDEGFGPQFMEENSRLFFSRSRITRAYTRGLSPTRVLELLVQLPDIEELIVKETEFTQEHLEEAPRLIPERQLDYFHLTACWVDIHVILALVTDYSLKVKTVSFHDCRFYLGGVSISEDHRASHIEEFNRNHPNIRFIMRPGKEPSPAESWDLFASHELPWAG